MTFFSSIHALKHAELLFRVGFELLKLAGGGCAQVLVEPAAADAVSGKNNLFVNVPVGAAALEIF